MSRHELLGVSDGFALFGNDQGLTVVVNLSNLDVFDPLPKLSVDFSRWDDGDPSLVQTEAFELADTALATASRVEGTDILIATAAPDKRSFAIPRAARDAASSGIAAVKQSSEPHTAVTLAMSRALTGNKPLNIAQVRHISQFFASNVELSDTTRLLWGGDPARRWADGIITRENDNAVLTSLDFVAEEPEPAAADADAEETIDSGEPHVYVPDPLHEYVCEECGQDEDMMIHEAEEAEAESVVASGVPTKPIATADQFFNVEVDRDDVVPDFYLLFEARADGTPSMITGILAHRVNDSWAKWSRHTHNWSDTAEPSDAFPVDDDSAYETAILFDTQDKDAIPAQEIDQFEWDQVQKAIPFMPNFKTVELEDLDFCVVMGEDKVSKTVIIIELYMRDEDDNCWRWNPVDVEWQHSSRCPKDCTSVDADTAREAAARLSAEASSKATGSQRRRFHGLPQVDSRLGPRLTKPGGPLRTPPVRTPQGPYEFDSAFNRAAWINGQRGGILDGPPGFSPGSTATSFAVTDLNKDGNYTPEERSANAGKQPRDAKGQFAKTGNIVHVEKTTKTAKIVAIDREKGQVKIKYPDGTTQWRSSKDVSTVKDSSDEAQAYKHEILTRDNTVVDARATDQTKKASLPYALPPLTPDDIKLMLTDYAAYIEKMRAQAEKLKRHASLNPVTTDVNPLYLAQVDELDKTAVVELYALVPKTKTNTDVLMYVRAEGGWVRDDKALQRLKSTSPPPLVTLDADTFKQVLDQVDSYFKDQTGAGEAEEPAEDTEASIVAALQARVDTILWDDTGALIPVFEAEAMTAAGVPGIADTPGDVAAARRLRRYWLRGRGAAKIRWNTPGDWTRCVKHLSKYMGPRAKGYCQNLHKSATGVYTGSKHNVGNKRGLRGDGSAVLLSSPTSVLASAADVTDDTQFLALLEVEEPSVVDLAELSYRQAGHKLRVGERFLVNGGDGVYALEVMEPTSTIGWEGAPAILVASAENDLVDLLQETGA